MAKKTDSDHILEKDALVNAGMRTLRYLEEDMQSYGFGTRYAEAAALAVEIYQAIERIDPGLCKDMGLILIEKAMLRCRK